MEKRPEGIVFGSELGGHRRESCDVCVVGSGPGGAVVADELARAGQSVLMIEEGTLPQSGADFQPDLAVPKYYRDQCLFTTNGPSQIGVPTGIAFGGTTVINSGTCLTTPDRTLDRWADELGIEFDRSAWRAVEEELETDLSISPCPIDKMSVSNRLFAEGLETLGLSGGHPLPRCEIDCEGSGRCCFVCPKEAKQAVYLNLLKRALDNGMRAIVETRAVRLKHKRGSVSEIRCHTAAGGRLTVRAKRYVLAMGALATPRFLLENGLGKRYRATGHHLTLHPAMKVNARMPEPVRSWEGVPQAYGYEHPDRPNLHFEGIFMPPHVAAMGLPLLGDDLADWMGAFDHVVGFGFFISDSNHGRLYRIPGVGPVVRYGLTPEDVDNFYFGIKLTARVYFAVGASRVLLPVIKQPNIYTSYDQLERGFRRRDLDSNDLYTMAFHPLGTCRFSASPNKGVVDQSGRCHHHDNLYICDGSAISGPLHVNPQITIMTFARLAARGMI